MIIEGLRTSSNQDLQNEAFKQAEKWVNGNFRAYTKSEAMFEKVNFIVNSVVSTTIHVY